MQLDDPPPRLERAEATMRAALDAGITLIDTAIAYGPAAHGAAAMGANERLVASLSTTGPIHASPTPRSLAL